MMFNIYINLTTIVFVTIISRVLGNLLSSYQDICGVTNGRKMFIELGEVGSVSAKNISLGNMTRCTLELITCPYCVISINFRYMNLSEDHCAVKTYGLRSSSCHCDYVWIHEPFYENFSGQPFCGVFSPFQRVVGYKSLTKSIVVTFFRSNAHGHAFSLEFSAERNRKFYKGSVSESPGIPENNVITSPYFPAFYPRDLTSEYVISCDINFNSKCQVRLVFTDFQLGTMSFMEVFDWNGERVDITTGSIFRPPIIVSSGPSLLIRLHANTGTGMGFKAFYSLLTTNTNDITVTPNIDCGGLVENLGGAITMMNMVDVGVQQAFDCIWLIKPPRTYLMKTHISLKVVTYENMINGSELVIREGLTSNKPIVQSVATQSISLNRTTPIEHLTLLNTGFFIYLRAIFSSKTRLAITYSTFSYNDCFPNADFFCHNHRCIPLQLSCDSFDHCGDMSDEPATCSRDLNLEAIDRQWYSHTPNYYFPKMEPYPDMKTATIVFFASSLGLIVLISALIFLLYRTGARTRHQRELQNQLQTITDLLDGTRLEDGILDEPPVYEAPPEYNEIIKVGISNKRNKHRQSSKSRSRSLSSRRKQRSDTKIFIQPLLNTLGPSTSTKNEIKSPVPDSPPPPYLEEFMFGPSSSVVQNGIKQTPSFSESGRQFSTIRKCRSQDDILIINKVLDSNDRPSNAFSTYSNDDRVSDRTFLNMSLMYEREKLCGRSFKDYKAMKSYFENLISKSKKSYKHVKNCNCDGACSCMTQPISDEYLMGQGSQRIRSVDDKLLAKSYSYLTNFKLWKSSDNSL